MSFSRRGRPLAEEEKSTDSAKARARAMELLAGQELSSGQLYERLGRKFTQPTAAAVVAEMVERQYVDDERYARTRAHGLLVARKSRRAAAQNLRQKGLDAQQISAALEEVQKSGAWFNYGAIRLGQGRDNAKQFLKDNPEIANDIEGQIRANADKLYATRRPAGKAAAAAAEKEEGGETASASKEPVVKAPARSSESELDIMVED